MKETLFSVVAGLILFKIKCRTSSCDGLNYNTILTLRLSGSLVRALTGKEWDPVNWDGDK